MRLPLTKLKIEFDSRHDFDGEDIETLKERWPGIKFHNIPIAWIFPIDEMMCRLRYKHTIYEVRQEYGQFCVMDRGVTGSQLLIIEEAEQQIYLIDVDLHELMECA